MIVVCDKIRFAQIYKLQKISNFSEHKAKEIKKSWHEEQRHEEQRHAQRYKYTWITKTFEIRSYLKNL